MTKQKEAILIFGILAFTAILYFFRLDRIPNGFYIDEATIGYNAYSLLLTGRDEYGKFFPVALRLLGSYTPPLYSYLLIPFIAIFDLTVTSTRMLSAVCGVASVGLYFLLIRQMPSIFSKRTAPFGAALFAITPWVIFYSRLGYEVYLAFFIFMAGGYFLCKALTQPKFLPLGFALVSISAYAAHTERILAPLLLFSFLVVFRKQVLSQAYRRATALGITLAALIQIPDLLIATTPAFFVKSNLFYVQPIAQYADKLSYLIPYPLRFSYAFGHQVLSIYLTYFSPRSLFFLPDPDPQRSLPNLSVFYNWMVLPYFVGLYQLGQKVKDNYAKFIVLLLIICPVPAALTGDPFATQRAIPLALPLSLIILVGLQTLTLGLSAIQRYALIAVVLLVSLTGLARSYFILFPKLNAAAWGYGYQQLAEFIAEHPNKQFVIDQTRMKPAYIEMAFFLKTAPQVVQTAADPKIRQNYYQQTEFTAQTQFASMVFRPIRYMDDVNPNTIIVGDPLTLSDGQAQDNGLHKTFEIRDPINTLIFTGFATQ